MMQDFVCTFDETSSSQPQSHWGGKRSSAHPSFPAAEANWNGGQSCWGHKGLAWAFLALSLFSSSCVHDSLQRQAKCLRWEVLKLEDTFHLHCSHLQCRSQISCISCFSLSVAASICTTKTKEWGKEAIRSSV